MSRNIEIKTRVPDIDALRMRAVALAGGAPATLIEQDDQFFAAPHGRLKLRRFSDGSAELIHYHRADTPEAKASDYVRVPVPEAELLAQALERACGDAGRVKKRRWLLLVGQARIHLDRVEGRGDFVELEVVLREGQPDAEGVAIAESLLADLGLAHAERVAGAYADLPMAEGIDAARKS